PIDQRLVGSRVSYVGLKETGEIAIAVAARRLDLERPPVVPQRPVPQTRLALLMGQVREPFDERSLEGNAGGVRFQPFFERGQRLVPRLDGVGELAGGDEQIAGGRLALRQVGAKLFVGGRFLQELLARQERVVERQPCVFHAARYEQRLGQVLPCL